MDHSVEPYPKAYARYVQNRRLFEQLRPGDRVVVEHRVRVGLRTWNVRTEGTVVQTRRVRQGLHWRRNWDDPAYADQIILRRDDGELTTVTLDEFSCLKRVDSAGSSPLSAAEHHGADSNPKNQ